MWCQANFSQRRSATSFCQSCQRRIWNLVQGTGTSSGLYSQKKAHVALDWRAPQVPLLSPLLGQQDQLFDLQRAVQPDLDGPGGLLQNVQTRRSEYLRLHRNDFGFEIEFSANVSQAKGLRISEVGISYYGRIYDEGKKINWKDGLKALGYIFWHCFV
jgi:hypothetical protein